MFGNRTTTRDRVTITVDGRPTPAERDPGGNGYWISHNGRRVLVPGSGRVTFNDLTGAVTEYSPRAQPAPAPCGIDPNDEAAVMRHKRAQVVAAGQRPIARLDERPTAVRKAQRELDRGARAAIEEHAVHEFRVSAPLRERVDADDMEELAELFLRCLVSDPALLTEARTVLDMLTAAVDSTGQEV